MKQLTLITMAAAVGLSVATSRPGDGITRWRFFTAPGPADYDQGGSWYTALGIKEAETFLRGYEAAIITYNVKAHPII